MIELFITDGSNRLGGGSVKLGDRAIFGYGAELNRQSRKDEALLQSAATHCSWRTLKDGGNMSRPSQGEGLL